MTNLFSVENIAFTLWGYPMSYVELVGTVFYLWSVWLISKRRILTWPIGIISVLLYMALFYQIRLYSDAVEQIYYLFASVYGWLNWTRAPKERGTVVSVRFSAVPPALIYLVGTILIGSLFGAFMSRVHNLMPTVFPEAASYPYVDALTTIGSFTAMWLMVKQRIESWLYWIVIDVVGVFLYYVKTVRFISLLYVVLLCLAVKGFVNWNSSRLKEPSDANLERMF